MNSFCHRLLVILALSCTACMAADVENAIMRVIVSYQEPDPFLPWQPRKPKARTGYGVLVGDGRVLTVEGLVRNHRLVELLKPRTGEKIPATVSMSDCQVNLALLAPQDPAALEALTPISISEQVPIDARLEIVQFDKTFQTQRGGAQAIQTAMSSLPEAPYRSLAYNVLTDVNVEGRGAPAVYRGKLAGLIMSYSRGSRIGEMIPYSVVRQFLDDTATPPYEGFAAAGFLWTPLVDPAKRDYLGVTREGQGILLVSCLPGSGAGESLKPNDVILEWDGHAIDNLGFYADTVFGRMNFAYLIKGHRRPGDSVQVRISRDGAERTVEVNLARYMDSRALIPENVPHERVDFLVEGGLVLRELTGDYLRAFGSNWLRDIDPRLVHLYTTRRQDAQNAGERVVILAGVLAHPINIGYQHLRNQVVTAVNGAPVTNIQDVFRIADRDGHVTRITLQSVGVDITLDSELLDQANARLASMYRLRTLRFEAGKHSTDVTAHPDPMLRNE